MAASRWSCDVLLSFSGNDVHKGFTGHLYAALCRSGFNTFATDDNFRNGVGEASLRIIQSCKFALVVLSQDYASYPCCLEELLQILRFKKAENVWPIFYDIDPSHVEEVTGSYGKAFSEHEKRFSNEVIEEWKNALQQLSYLKGLDLQKHLDGREADNIDHIVGEISKRLDQVMLSVAMHPVGLHSRVQQVKSLMFTELEDTRIVGIYGMGGIGKSTIAKEVFNSLLYKFDSSCFLDNVREVSQSRGIAYLQRQLLTEILRTKHEKIENVDRGLDLIIQNLSQKKVLLVLDDVDKLDQIDKILGKCDWLFPGSMVIITTRMKEMLESSKSYCQYEVSELVDSDSLKLLSLHAFGKLHPATDYIDCAKKMVDYAGGIPLALEVLGSSLSGQSVDVWNSRLEKLKVIANDDIHSKLKISFDSLGDTEQSIFLDTACFFIGFDMNYVMSILDGCDFSPINGINTLLKRCLLKVGSNNKLFMHDLLRDMGRETVRQENAIDPGERSRLWHHEDVIDVLSDKIGTTKVLGLIMNTHGFQPSWGTKAFKKMKMLRVLQLNYVSLKGSYEYVSRKLRWLCWRECPLASIPLDFGLEYLVALDMRYSKLIQFSEDGKSLMKLKFLNLNHSHELVETLDFGSCTNLEKLTFKDCISLEVVHDTIGLLNHLVFLSFQDCKKLECLPGSIGGLVMLEKLNMSGCLKLENVPDSIGCLTHLVLLNFQNCENLKRIPGSIGNLKSLKELNMSGCSKLEDLPESTGLLTYLHLLDLHDCKGLKHLPESIGDLKALEKLTMSGCTNLEDLPESAGCFISLRIWYLQDCKNLKSFPQEILGLRFLRELNMSGCSKLEELPDSLGNLKSLVALNLDGTAISTLTENIQNLNELTTLSLRDCPRVFSPRKNPYIINFLPFSLKELDISFCKILDGVIPQDLQGMLHLEELKLSGNDFKSLPNSICNLSKLSALYLDDCEWLLSIPQLQSSIDALHANNCPVLETIDLTNFRGDAELELNSCLSLKEIEGYFNLEPLAIEVVEKLLGRNASSLEDLVTNSHVRKIDNLTKTSTICPLQTLSERCIHSIFMPGTEIPTWFSHQSKGDTVSCNVPCLDSSFKIIGIVTCAIYAWQESSESCYFSSHVTISNNSKMYEWIYNPYVTFLSCEVEQDMNWLCYWIFNDLKDESDLDMSWRFNNEMEEGDEVEFSIDLGVGINVKKCGIHLLYQSTDSQPDDLADVTSKEDIAPPKTQEFVKWSEQRSERAMRFSCPQYDNIYKLSPMIEELEEGSSRRVKLELQRNSGNMAKVMGQIVKMEREIFPEYESQAAAFDQELKKKDSMLLYLEIAEDVVGFVMCSCPSSLFAHINVIAVKENHRKQGHGEALMKAAIETCRTRKAQQISLHVDSSNTGAMSLYIKLGFEVEELVQSYYSPDRFTGHLYAALCWSGFNTFVTDEKFGNGIGKASLRIIQSSKFALVLSEDYASSSWCLEELVQILKLKKPGNVWPIFYDVDPSHVEEVTGSYGEASSEHQKSFSKEVIEEWKKALQQVSYLKGLALQKHLDGREADNIDHIVGEISNRLA
ncbi:Disease resistance protein (TIR-NBS-LRR class) family [Euphorbia peplus]|nr:Disease resistance protein (TIR-NBS-LRR class) family [Euphorbia peplus]